MPLNNANPNRNFSTEKAEDGHIGVTFAAPGVCLNNEATRITSLPHTRNKWCSAPGEFSGSSRARAS